MHESPTHDGPLTTPWRLAGVLIALLVIGGAVVIAANGSGSAGSTVTPVGGADMALLTTPAGKTASAGSVEVPEVVGEVASTQRSSWAAPQAIASAQGLSAAVEHSSETTVDATAAIRRATLLDGRIKVRDVTIVAQARIGEGGAGGSLDGSGSVTVDGTDVGFVPNTAVPIDGIGTLTVNQQAVVSNLPTGTATSGPRYRVVGAAIHLRITNAQPGLPAGSELVIGRVDTGIKQARAAADAPTTDETASEGPRGWQPPTSDQAQNFINRGIQPGTPAPGADGLPVRGSSVAAYAPPATGNLEGYLFPVFGAASFSNDYYGSRSTGTHRATDIFGAEGTPVVAIADGVLDRVGWNSLGGNRFWLYDRYGNAFYYAHLQAFTPRAQDGAFVRAGDVLGFLGDTGNAKGTPPHVHFEIHTPEGQVLNPYTYLPTWNRGIIVDARDSGLQELQVPGSLVDMTDVSGYSTLSPEVIDAIAQVGLDGSIESTSVPADGNPVDDAFSTER